MSAKHFNGSHLKIHNRKTNKSVFLDESLLCCSLQGKFMRVASWKSKVHFADTSRPAACCLHVLLKKRAVLLLQSVHRHSVTYPSCCVQRVVPRDGMYLACIAILQQVRYGTYRKLGRSIPGPVPGCLGRKKIVEPGRKYLNPVRVCSSNSQSSLKCGWMTRQLPFFYRVGVSRTGCLWET